jgi:mRNA interferase RelE/StbE
LSKYSWRGSGDDQTPRSQRHSVTDSENAPQFEEKNLGLLKMILSKPNCGKALMDELSGLRSMRVNSFRITYRIKSAQGIELVAIGPRERIYEETFRLIQKSGEEREE